MQYTILCKNRSENNSAKYKALRSKAKKMVARAMNNEDEKENEKLGRNPNNIFILVKSMQEVGKDVEEVNAQEMKEEDWASQQ